MLNNLDKSLAIELLKRWKEINELIILSGKIDTLIFDESDDLGDEWADLVSDTNNFLSNFLEPINNEIKKEIEDVSRPKKSR